MRYRAPQPIADYNSELFERWYSQGEYWHQRQDSDHFYGRPIPEWRVRRPHWHRPVFGGPRRGYRKRCRIVEKERVNGQGERVEIRRTTCR